MNEDYFVMLHGLECAVLCLFFESNRNNTEKKPERNREECGKICRCGDLGAVHDVHPRAFKPFHRALSYSLEEASNFSSLRASAATSARAFIISMLPWMKPGS